MRSYAPYKCVNILNMYMLCLQGVKSSLLFHLGFVFHMASGSMNCSTSLSVEQLHNSSIDSIHHHRNQSKSMSFPQRRQMLISGFERSVISKK